MTSLPHLPSIPLGPGAGSGSGSTSASNSNPSSPQNTLDITSPTASPRYPVRSLGPHPPTSKTHGHPAFASLTHPLASFTIEFDDVNRRRGGAKPFRICFIVENMPHGGEPLECFIDAKVYAHKAFSNTYANYKRGRYGSTIVNEHIAFVVCGLVKNVEKDMVMMNMKNMKHHPSYALSVGAIYTVSFYCSPYLANCSVRYINTHSDYASLRIQVEQDVTHQNISQILSSAALIAANGQQPQDEMGHPHAMNGQHPNDLGFGGVPLSSSHPAPHDPSAYPPMSHDPPMVKSEPYDELGPPQPVPVKMIHTGFGGPQRIGAVMQQQLQGSFPRPFGAPPDIPGFTTPFQAGPYPSQSHISFPMVPPRTGASPISTSPSAQHAHFADHVLDLDPPQDTIMTANGHVKRRRSGQSTPSQPLSVPSYQPAPFHPQTQDPTYGLTRQFSNSMLPPGFLRTFSKPQPHKRNRRNSGPLPDPIPQQPSLATTMQQMTLVPPTTQTTTSSSLDLSRQTSFDVWLNQQGSSLLAAPNTATHNTPSYPYYPSGPNQLYPPGVTAPATSTSTTSTTSTSNSASQPIDLSREASLDVWRSIQNDLSHTMSNAHTSNTNNPTPLGRMRSFSDPNLANTPFLQLAMMGYHAQYHQAMQQQQQRSQQQQSSSSQQSSQEERPTDVQFETYNLIDLSEMTSNTDNTSVPQLNLSTQASLQFSISGNISGTGTTTQTSLLPLEPSTSLMLSTASSLLLSTAPSLTTSLLTSSSSLLPSLSITNPDLSERSLYRDSETFVPASSESSLPTWQPSTTTQLNLEPGISL